MKTHLLGTATAEAHGILAHGSDVPSSRSGQLGVAAERQGGWSARLGRMVLMLAVALGMVGGRAQAEVAPACAYKLRLISEFEGGWSGGTVQLRQGESVLETFGAGFTDGAELEVAVATALVPGQTYNLYWNEGGDFPAEMGFELLLGEEILGSLSYGSQDSVNSILFSFVATCGSVTACGSYTWAVSGVTYEVSGLYTAETGGVTYTLDLTVEEGETTTEEVTFTATYSDEPYPWHVHEKEFTFTESGTYEDTEGCDTQILKLTYVPFAADSTAPVVSEVVVAPSPMAVTSTAAVVVSALVDDGVEGSVISSASLTVNGMPMSMTGGFSSSEEAVVASFTLGQAGISAPGVYEVCVTGTDAAGNESEPSCALLVVYDPNGGFVTGGGSIYSEPGAYLGNVDAEGRANFGFVAKYGKTKTGGTVLQGNTQFTFQVGHLDFASTSYEWLVVNRDGQNAQFKGEGRLNGQGQYGFMVWAGDGDPKILAPDTFRIRIWDGLTGLDVYDNGTAQPLASGSILISVPKK